MDGASFVYRRIRSPESNFSMAGSSTTNKSTSVKRAKTKTGIKSRARVREHGEVFTEQREVKAMCNLCEPDLSDITKKVLEPGCGTGNFLVEILERRIRNEKHKKDPYKILIAVSNLYGIDIALDNLEEARTRLRNIVFDYLGSSHVSGDFLLALDTILKTNIIYGDLLNGRKDIFLVNWVPIGEAGFELEKWSFAEIEQGRKRVVKAEAVSRLPEAVQSLFEKKPPDKSSSTRKPRQKPKEEPVEQLPIFKLLGDNK